MKKINYFEILQQTSGHFLTEHIPDNWNELSGVEQDTFLENNAWEPFEYWQVDDVFELIVSAADSTKRFLEQAGVEVVDAK